MNKASNKCKVILVLNNPVTINLSLSSTNQKYGNKPSKLIRLNVSVNLTQNGSKYLLYLTERSIFKP